MQIQPSLNGACCPQAEPKPGLPWTTRLCRQLVRLRTAVLGDKHIRELPIGHPDAFVNRPGERRIVFANKVIIIRDRQHPKP